MTPRLFWPAVVAGWAVMAVGVVGVAGEGRDVPPLAFVRWLVGLALVHDLVLVPLVLAAGTGVRRVAPAAWRAPLAAGLVVAAVVTAFAWPYVQGWGVLRSNPSIQPRDYGDGLVALLALVAVATVAWGLWRVRRGR